MLILSLLIFSPAKANAICLEDSGRNFICEESLPQTVRWSNKCLLGCYLLEAVDSEVLGRRVVQLQVDYDEAYKTAIKAGALNRKLNITVEKMSKDFDFTVEQYSILDRKYKKLTVVHLLLKEDSYTFTDTLWIGLGSATIGGVITVIVIFVTSIK